MLGVDTTSNRRRRSDDVAVIRPRRYETLDELDRDIGQLRNAIGEIAAIEADWDSATMPVRIEMGEIETSIRESHRCEGDAVVALDLSNAAKERRAGLFAAHDRLRRAHGPDLTEWRRARQILKQARQDLKTLASLRATFKPSAPVRPRDAAQGSVQGRLF